VTDQSLTVDAELTVDWLVEGMVRVHRTERRLGLVTVTSFALLLLAVALRAASAPTVQLMGYAVGAIGCAAGLLFGWLTLQISSRRGLTRRIPARVRERLPSMGTWRFDAKGVRYRNGDQLRQVAWPLVDGIELDAGAVRILLPGDRIGWLIPSAAFAPVGGTARAIALLQGWRRDADGVAPPTPIEPGTRVVRFTEPARDSRSQRLWIVLPAVPAGLFLLLPLAAVGMALGLPPWTALTFAAPVGGACAIALPLAILHPGIVGRLWDIDATPPEVELRMSRNGLQRLSPPGMVWTLRWTAVVAVQPSAHQLTLITRSLHPIVVPSSALLPESPSAIAEQCETWRTPVTTVGNARVVDASIDFDPENPFAAPAETTDQVPLMRTQTDV
jgi:hypothetical protein